MTWTFKEELDLDQLAKIRQHGWKNPSNSVKFESYLLKTNEDISETHKRPHGDRAATILLKWISFTKVSKYGKSEYSRASFERELHVSIP